jgi:hypothetical protein
MEICRMGNQKAILLIGHPQPNLSETEEGIIKKMIMKISIIDNFNCVNVIVLVIGLRHYKYQ